MPKVRQCTKLFGHEISNCHDCLLFKAHCCILFKLNSWQSAFMFLQSFTTSGDCTTVSSIVHFFLMKYFSLFSTMHNRILEDTVLNCRALASCSYKLPIGCPGLQCYEAHQSCCGLCTENNSIDLSRLWKLQMHEENNLTPMKAFNSKVEGKCIKCPQTN